MASEYGEQLAKGLLGIARRLHGEMKERASMALNPTQVQALFFIRCHENPTMREIANYLAVRPPSATALIEEFVRLKIVQRVPDSQDKRAIRVQLTAQGKRLIRMRLNVLIEQIEQLTKPLTREEKRLFGEILKKILTPLDEHLV